MEKKNDRWLVCVICLLLLVRCLHVLPLSKLNEIEMLSDSRSVIRFLSVKFMFMFKALCIIPPDTLLCYT